MKKPSKRSARPRRAAAKAAAKAPKKSAPVPKKAKRKYPAAFVDLLAKFDDITDRLGGTLESHRAASERRQKEMDRAALEMRAMLLGVAEENAKLRDHADSVEALAETMIAAAKAACASTLGRDFSAQKLDPLGDTTRAADQALDSLRKSRVALYAPAAPEPAADETPAADSAAAANVSAPTPAAAAPEAGEMLTLPPGVHVEFTGKDFSQDTLDEVSRALDEMKRQSEAVSESPPAKTLWAAPHVQQAPDPIRTEIAKNSVTAIAKAPGFWKGMANWLNAVDTDKRTLFQHLRGETEFGWTDENRLQTRDGYAAMLHFDEHEQRCHGYVWVRGEDKTFIRVSPVDAWTLAAAKRQAEKIIVSHRAAVLNAARFTQPKPAPAAA